jgi:hypothetical protein
VRGGRGRGQRGRGEGGAEREGGREGGKREGKERGGSGKREGGRWENEKGRGKEREGDGVSEKRESHREAEVACTFLLRISDFFEQNGGPKTSSPSLPETGISMDRLQHIGKVFSTEPADFNTHNSEN